MTTEQQVLLEEFFTWLNSLEELGYTEKGIEFYVNGYLKEKT